MSDKKYISEITVDDYTYQLKDLELRKLIELLSGKNFEKDSNFDE